MFAEGTVGHLRLLIVWLNGMDFGHFLCFWVGPYCGQQASDTCRYC